MQVIRGYEFDPTWGIVLILVGLVSFVVRSGTMLAVYGVTLAWAAIMNLLSGDALWMVMGAVQVVLAVVTFLRFGLLRTTVRRLGSDLGADQAGRPDRAAALFPFAGCGLTILSFAGMIGAAVAIGLAEGNSTLWSDQVVGTLYDGLLGVACLGLAFAIAALAARFRYRAISILTTVGFAVILALVVVVLVAGTAA